MPTRNSRIALRLATVRRRLAGARRLKRAYAERVAAQEKVIAAHRTMITRMSDLHNKLVPKLVSLYDKQQANMVRLLDDIEERSPEALRQWIADARHKANQVGELVRRRAPRNMDAFRMPALHLLHQTAA